MSEAFDLIAFRDFCAGKPKASRYYSADSTSCALTQFCRANGIPGPQELFWNLPNDVQNAICKSRRPTFSALASRLSALIREGGNV